MRLDLSKNAQCSFIFHSYPKLFPLLEQHLGISRDRIVSPLAVEAITLPPAVKNEAFITRIKRVLEADQIAFDKTARIEASLGNGYRDALKLRNGELGRVTDMVLYPKSHDQVQKIVTLACEYDVSLIPVGSGNNAVGSITPLDGDSRMIVSIDLSRMNQVLAIDQHSQIVIVEAGITTEQLKKTLKQFNLTPTWEHSSIANSSIGGIIAAGKSLISNNCGDNQDLLLNCRLATPMGSIDSQVKSSIPHPLCIEKLVVGSEGTLGIITELAISVRAIPEKIERWVVSFPDFERGATALHQMSLEGCMPSSCKLLDPSAAELIGKLEVTESWLEKIQGRISNWTLPSNPNNSACLLALEFQGSAHLVHEWRGRALSCCQKNSGQVLSRAKANQLAKTESKLPHLKNLLLDHLVMVDYVTASVSWNNLIKVQHGVVESLNQLLSLWSKKGAVISYVSEINQSGVHLNFIFAALQPKGFELEQIDAVRTEAMKTINNLGASLYLGGGIGLVNQKFIKQELGEAAVEGMKALKRKIDPQNVMNPGKAFAQKREPVVTKRIVESPLPSERRRFIHDKAAALIQ